MQFLMGLNESYAGVRAQILMIDPLPSISKVFNLIIQEERQRSIGAGTLSAGDTLTFAASASSVTST